MTFPAGRLDAHVHLERGPYTGAWLSRFVETAVRRGIGTIWLLEHSHRFLEFRPMYAGIEAYSAYQREWLSRKSGIALGDYLDFARAARAGSYPVELKWGLEVCYIPGTEAFVRELLGGSGLDFLTGSVHWIDGWGFDHSPESWQGRDVDAVYPRYYDIMLDLVRSGLFDNLAHPDSIKCFGHRPSADLSPRYDALAEALAAAGMKAEMSAGLANNYGLAELGMSPPLLSAMRRHGVKLVPASDAHRPEDVGRNLDRFTETR